MSDDRKYSREGFRSPFERHRPLNEEDIKFLEEEVCNEVEDPDSVMLREIARRQHDFSGFDHCNIYDEGNFKSGVLAALERTRQRLSVESMEKVIDFYAVLGYSCKRIIYQLFELGFENFYNRQVRTYLHRNKHRIHLERSNLMNELAMLQRGVFQQSQDRLMEVERRIMELRFDNVEELTKKLQSLSPVDDAAEYNKINRQIEMIMEKISKANGLEDFRKVAVEVAKEEAKAKITRKYGQGYVDQRLKAEQARLDAESPIDDGVRSLEGAVSKVID